MITGSQTGSGSVPDAIQASKCGTVSPVSASKAFLPHSPTRQCLVACDGAQLHNSAAVDVAHTITIQRTLQLLPRMCNGDVRHQAAEWEAGTEEPVSETVRQREKPEDRRTSAIRWVGIAEEHEQDEHLRHPLLDGHGPPPGRS